MIILEFIEHYNKSLTLLLALGLFFWPLFKYLHSKTLELKQLRFENYHKLIKRLNVPPRTTDDTCYLDMQKAVVFELRDYKEYKLLTQIIFRDWIARESKLSGLMKDTLAKLGL